VVTAVKFLLMGDTVDGDKVSREKAVAGENGGVYGCNPGSSSTGVGYRSSSLITYPGTAFEVADCVVNRGIDNL
jgi:hypothetical protein